MMVCLLFLRWYVSFYTRMHVPTVSTNMSTIGTSVCDQSPSFLSRRNAIILYILPTFHHDTSPPPPKSPQSLTSKVLHTSSLILNPSSTKLPNFLTSKFTSPSDGSWWPGICGMLTVTMISVDWASSLIIVSNTAVNEGVLAWTLPLIAAGGIVVARSV